MIEINNITKVYKKGTESFTALEDVSFRIGKGDYVAVTGPSGAGKSTILYTIGGLVHPDSGTVLFEGENLYEQNEKFLNSYRKSHVGFVFQQFHLMPYLTVLENIRLNNHRKQADGIINDYLEKCSIAGLMNKYPSELSVGEKQRAAFIRAIISEPEILLADEPTGNLDPENSSVIMQLIREYNNKGGTVILVSHNPDAIKYASRVVSLERGRLTNAGQGIN